MDHNLTSRGTERLRPPYVTRPGDWPQEHIDLLISRWAEGASMTLIANEVGRSRNAVAGQITKLRNKGVVLDARIKGGSRKVRIKEAVPSVPCTTKAPPMPVVIEKPIRIRLNVVESPIAVTFAELQPHHCKFPMGDPRRSDFRFCGGHRLENKPYCQEHTTITETQPFRRRSPRPAWQR